MVRGFLGVVMMLVGVMAWGGCQSAYYSAWEKMGYHKRDILVERVEKARDGQEAAKEQFKTTLEKFKGVVKFEGGALEAKYNELNSQYEICATRAAAVTKQIDAVEAVSGAMFKEWENELAQYQSAELKAKSAEELRLTEVRYKQMVGTMRAAESKMKPVLAAFHDQVLFLKHNLNARAIASLQGTTVTLQGDVDRLIADMQKSIEESDRFIQSMKKEG